ncbi:hypothetical protein SMC26_40910 [Actinomadura fulvescens]|uniref:Uncharacterized protein n=1 Tax=Actinomadura fulvescens TaxID=46160 RepID=A0ABP6DDZ5_9ACTN
MRYTYAPLAGAEPGRVVRWTWPLRRRLQRWRLQAPIVQREGITVHEGPHYAFRSPSSCVDCKPCVEVDISRADNRVLLPEEWRHLVAAIKAGEFDI